MKTIKIIDLLNKIANGEEVPNKIKYQDIIYEYKCGLVINPDNLKRDIYTYVHEEHPKPNECIYIYFSDEIKDFVLNDEVEIIEDAEEDKKIEKMGILYTGINSEIYENFAMKINEVIDIVNKLNKED